MGQLNQQPESTGHSAIGFRPAVEADSEFCFLVRELAFRKYAERVRGWDEEREQAIHRTRFASQNYKVIQFAGRDVGVLSAKTEPAAIKVFQVFILPEYQSKGIGASVMKQIMQKSVRLRLPIRLQVINGNDRALLFYERLGFHRIGITDTHIQMERSP